VSDVNVPEAVSIRCDRCGGTFGFVPHPGNARCPYCAFDQPVSAELLHNLQRYAGSVGQKLHQANEAYQRAATWEQWAEQSRRSVPRLKLVIPIASGVSLLGAVALPVAQSLGVPPAEVAPLVGPLVTLPTLFLMGYIFWAYVGPGVARKHAAAGHVAVACSNCGAKMELVVGAPSQVCGYCRAALVASPVVMGRGIDAAELSHRRARLEEFRQERLGMVGLYRYDMTAYLPFIIGGSFLVPLGGSALALTGEMQNGSEPYTPAIFLLWMMVVGLVAWLVGIFLLRRSRKERYQRALQDLGRQFPLERIDDALGLADWLNRHWPVKYEVTLLRSGHDLVAASIDAFGYPALLNAEFGSAQDREPRLHVLLAAHQPAGHVLHPDAATYVQGAFARCRELGFEITPSEAGLLAIADDDTVRIVRKNPEALHEVAMVLGTLAHAARAAGALPAERAI
jgi:DNA-directed RNA polymerase subunit RPC12/RpoP/cbb3-type cytochrome oxidase subunit 3